MKKLLTALICSFSALPLLAASTCQTRVDKNINKTTAEKVMYCLNDEPEVTPVTKEPEVILANVYTVKYPKQNNQSQTKTQQSAQERTTKVYSPTPVAMRYYQRDVYPPFRNDILPHFSSVSADDTAITALRNERLEQEKPARKIVKQKKTYTKTKSKKKMVKKVVSQTATTVEEKEAQTLQEDPLTTNLTTDAYSQDFPGISATPADFGYNDTDPALQQ